MRRIAGRIRGAAFALGVAAALGFGVSQAVAAGPNICPRTSVGSCSSQDNCLRKCERLGLPPGAGCSNGCCYCSLI